MNGLKTIVKKGFFQRAIYLFSEPWKPPIVREEMSEGNLKTSISGLSADVIAKRKEATELSDAATIDQVINDIRMHNVALAEALSALAENFAYDDILALT